MSEASTDRADRSAEVTDHLLWGLANAVADTHQADEDGVCVSPSCVGAAWPCAAWDHAQEGLRAALTAPDPAPSATTDAVDGAGDDFATGWSASPLPAAPGRTAAESSSRPAAISAA